MNGCRLVKTELVVADPLLRTAYINDYCRKEETWRQCRRYQTKKALWICPDFVLPDSDLTEDEIIDLYEKLEKTP